MKTVRTVVTTYVYDEAGRVIEIIETTETKEEV